MDNEPFLPGRRPSSEASTEEDIDHQTQPLDLSRSPRFFGLIFTLKFLIQFTTSLLELPLLRLVEQTICRAHLGRVNDGHDGEVECKVPAVQDKLALIMGYKWASDALPCLLTALLYGSLADSRGRKFVILLSIVGQLLALGCVMLVCFPRSSMPVEFIWFASLFLLIGGGTRVELSMAYTTFSDVIPWSKRTRALFYLHAATHSARLVGPPLGSLLMSSHLWAPFTLAIGALLGRCIVLWFIPETSPYLIGAEPLTAHAPDEAINSIPIAWRLQDASTFASKLYYHAKISKVRHFLKHRGLTVILVCFAIKRIGFASESLTFQYASEILHKQISQTVWLRVANALGATVLLGVILPMITQSPNLKSPGKDLWVMRGSLINAMMGFVTLWQGKSFTALCIGMAICGLGEGLEPGLQSFGSYIVGERNHATFFTFVSQLDVVGDLLGGPIMARTYTIRGADRQPAGFCFLLSAALFGCLLALTVIAKTSRI